VKAGLITKQQSQQIKRAIERKETPLWNTQLGGEIFIHGNGSSPDWTWGCIALNDPDVKELFDIIPVKTPVKIIP
jgi:lipoprotein-anchoring transpeptidase ErfK/SrfK